MIIQVANPQALGVVQRLHPNLLLSARRFSVALNAMAIPVDEVPTLGPWELELFWMCAFLSEQKSKFGD
jgi:hypothetical protein